MTPLVDVIAVREDDSLATVLNVSLDNGHSRLPVLGSTVSGSTVGSDQTSSVLVVGLLATKDLLRPLRIAAGDRFKARDAMRPPFFLLADTRIASALEQLRHERTLMAVVIQGRDPIGIVTLEDLLEELVGEIEDEWDDEAALRVETLPAPHDSEDHEPQFVMTCDRPHEVTIREAERFWRESGAGLLRLRVQNGELAPPDETLDEYGVRFLTEPAQGQRAVVGETRPENYEAGEDEDEKAELARMESTLIAAVALELRNVVKGRILALALLETAQVVPLRGIKSSVTAGEASS